MAALCSALISRWTTVSRFSSASKVSNVTRSDINHASFLHNIADVHGPAHLAHHVQDLLNHLDVRLDPANYRPMECCVLPESFQPTLNLLSGLCCPLKLARELTTVVQQQPFIVHG